VAGLGAEQPRDAADGRAGLPDHDDEPVVRPQQRVIQAVFVVQDLVEQVGGAGLRRVARVEEQLLQPEIDAPRLASLHLVVTLDGGVAAEDMPEHTGVGAHVAQQENPVARPRAAQGTSQGFHAAGQNHE